MRKVRAFTSPDGKREVVIYQRSNGLFSFAEKFEDTEDMTDFGLGIDTYWSVATESGLYGTADAAEQDARQTIAWLRENSN